MYNTLTHTTGTYTGHYEPVKEMADLLDEYEAKTGNNVPIHGQDICFATQIELLIRFTPTKVDGASGAFVAPFATVCPHELIYRSSSHA